MQKIIYGGQNGNKKIENDIKFIGFADRAERQLIVEDCGKRELWHKRQNGYAGYSIKINNEGSDYEFISSTIVPSPLKKWLNKVN